MNGCKTKIDISESTIRRLNLLIQKGGNVQNFVQKFYPNRANEIMEIISEAVQNKQLLTSDMFNEHVDNSQKVEEKPSGTYPDIKEEESVPISLSGDPGAYRRILRSFQKIIIEASVYDGKYAINPNKVARDFSGTDLNKEIFAAKDRLLQDIKDYTKGSWIIDNPGPVERQQIIETALLEFELIDSQLPLESKRGKSYLDARDAYMILSNFDTYLNDFAPYVGIKAGIHKTEPTDKYIWKGPNTDLKHQSFTDDGKENDAEFNTSDLAIAILDYFTEYKRLNNGKLEAIPENPITLTGFYQSMTAFKDWVNSLDNNKIEKLIGVNHIKAMDRFYSNESWVVTKLFNEFVSEAASSKVLDRNSNTLNVEKLYGIQEMMFRGLGSEIVNTLWALSDKTEANIVKIVSYYDGKLSDRMLQDNYRYIQGTRIADSVQTQVSNFNEVGTTNRRELARKYGIKWDKLREEFTIFTGKDYQVTLRFKDKGIGFTTEVGDGYQTNYTDTANKVASEHPDILIRFIEEFTGNSIPDDYQTLLKRTNTTAKNLFSLYGTVIGLILYGTENEDTKRYLKWLDSHNPDKISLDLRDYKLYDSGLARFLGLAYGTNVASTLKNPDGNLIPAFVLTSEIRAINKLAYKLGLEQSDTNVYTENPVYKSLTKNKQNIGKPIVRNYVDIKGVKKHAKQLTEPEVAYLGIVQDFFNTVFADKKDAKYIHFQNTAFADKNTHFIIQYAKDMKIGDTNLLNAILNVISGKENAEDVFINAIYTSRKDAYSKILKRIFDDYSYIFGITDKKDYFNPKNQLDYIKDKIKTYSKSDLKAHFNGKKEFIEEFHISKNGFNETLENALKTYVLTINTDKLKARLKAQEKLFLQDLIDLDFRLEYDTDPYTITSMWEKLGSQDQWRDKVTKDIKLSNNGELNPILKAYILADSLLSSSFNEILFGYQFYHPNKYKPSKNNGDYKADGTLSDLYFAHAEASRLSASYKRTVNAGATTHLFRPSKYGVSKEIDISVIEDIEADVYNMLGIKDIIDSQDGAGWSSPYQALFENWSLPGAQVGWDKKTIMSDTEASTGRPKLLKWAVFAITNDRRRMSMGSKASLELAFRKMHSRKLSLKPDFSVNAYYNPGDGNLSDGDRQLTYKKQLYRWNPNTQQHYKLEKLTQTNNEVVQTWTPVDNRGNKVGESFDSNPITLNTIYDLDQVFGGPYCKTLDDFGELTYSDANIEIVANIICHQNQKDKFIGYLVNKSAIKVGAGNVNTNKAFWDKDIPLQTMKMSTQFGGVQMNADHELDLSEVTEMTQMISSLAQSGLFSEYVNQIYKDIGSVVYESLSKEWKAYFDGDFDTIHDILGKALVNSYKTEGTDAAGLAASLIANATEAYNKNEKNINLPFSDPTINSKFVATLISNLNKSGIRRKYKGFAGVQVPSRNAIQYYRLGGQAMMYEDVCKYVHDLGLEKPALYYIQNPGSLINGEWMLDGKPHPFINIIETKHSIDIGDTLITDQGEIIEVNDFLTYYKLRNLPTTSTYYKWSIKPIDLRPDDTTFTLNGISNNFSIYDLDSVASSHYLNKWVDNGVINIEKVIATEPDFDLMWNALARTIGEELPLEGEISKAEVLRYKALIQRAINRDLKTIQEKGLLGYNVSFGQQFNEEGFLVTDWNHRNAEMIHGRTNAKELDLKEGDSHYQIMKQGEAFFQQRLATYYTFPSEELISRNDYEVMLVGPNGKKLFIAIDNLHNDFNSWNKNKSIESIEGEFYYNEIPLAKDDGGVKFYSKASGNGIVDLAVVNSFDKLTELLNAKQFLGYRFNYNINNADRLFAYEQRKNLDENGNLTADIFVTDFNNISRKYVPGTNIQTITRNTEELARILKANQDKILKTKIVRQSLARFEAYKKQLTKVGARIPTQSMQSFMTLDCIGFSESKVNEVYVPATLAWLQGSKIVIGSQNSENCWKLLKVITLQRNWKQ